MARVKTSDPNASLVLEGPRCSTHSVSFLGLPKEYRIRKKAQVRSGLRLPVGRPFRYLTLDGDVRERAQLTYGRIKRIATLLRVGMDERKACLIALFLDKRAPTCPGCIYLTGFSTGGFDRIPMRCTEEPGSPSCKPLMVVEMGTR